MLRGFSHALAEFVGRQDKGSSNIWAFAECGFLESFVDDIYIMMRHLRV
jgi:hypothetical protein